tara:strand:+ start:266 stop:472 length:207 start_codon:yes stop_codon:yes gene_type:complete
MELNEGDLVVTLPRVEKIRAIIDQIGKDQVGVITSISSKFDSKIVYGVLIDGEVYYLFEDEITKLEKE